MKVFSDFEKILILKNNNVLQLLQNGVSESYVKKLISKPNIDPYLLNLYSWRNGTTDIYSREIAKSILFPFFIFLSIEDCFGYHEIGVQQGKWSDYLLPIMTSGAHDYLLFNTIDSKIYFLSPSDTDFSGVISIYDNIESMILTTIESYEQEVYYWHIDRYCFTHKPSVLIGKKFNPNSDYWQLFTDEVH